MWEYLSAKKARMKMVGVAGRVRQYLTVFGKVFVLDAWSGPSTVIP